MLALLVNQTVSRNRCPVPEYLLSYHIYLNSYLCVISMGTSFNALVLPTERCCLVQCLNSSTKYKTFSE